MRFSEIIETQFQCSCLVSSFQLNSVNNPKGIDRKFVCWPHKRRFGERCEGEKERNRRRFNWFSRFSDTVIRKSAVCIHTSSAIPNERKGFFSHRTMPVSKDKWVNGFTCYSTMNFSLFLFRVASGCFFTHRPGSVARKRGMTFEVARERSRNQSGGGMSHCIIVSGATAPSPEETSKGLGWVAVNHSSLFEPFLSARALNGKSGTWESYKLQATNLELNDVTMLASHKEKPRWDFKGLETNCFWRRNGSANNSQSAATLEGWNYSNCCPVEIN